MKKVFIFKHKNIKSFSVVEIMLAIAIFTFLAIAIGSMLSYSSQTNASSGDKDKATFLAQEGMEAIIAIRNEDYSNLVDGAHGLAIVSNQWQLQNSSDQVGQYNRQINISQIDIYQKKVEVIVSWTNKFDNLQEIKLTRVLADINRQLILQKSWANAIKSAVLDLPGNDDGLRLHVQGDYAYVLRTDSRKLEIVNVSNPNNMQLVSFINFTGTPVAIKVDGNYAYIATNNNIGELVVVDITNPASPTIAGTFNVVVGTTPLDLAYMNNHIFMVFPNSGAHELFAINVANPGSMSLADSINVARGANRIDLNSSYAFVSSSSNNSELQVFNISNPANIQLTKTLNLSGNQDGIYIDVDQNLLAIYRSNQNVDFVDINNPVAPVYISSYSPVSQVTGVKINQAKGLLFVLSAKNKDQLDIVNIQDINNPTRYTILDIGFELRDLYYDELKDIAFAVGISDSEELIMVEPQ